MNGKPDIPLLRETFKNTQPGDLLRSFLSDYGKRIAFSSSLGEEDQVLTHIICSIDPGVRIFTLDTGRFFQETYDLMAETMARYGMKFEVYFPEAGDVESLVRAKGPNSFYESIDNRKECCFVRKIKPLGCALRNTDVWITGLRKSQSDTRQTIEKIEWVEDRGIIKINPLADWTLDMVRSYIRDNLIPVNKLHDKGFPSIGCAPCTRAVAQGEDIRSGRWWWERADHKECGLHDRRGGTKTERGNG